MAADTTAKKGTHAPAFVVLYNCPMDVELLCLADAVEGLPSTLEAVKEAWVSWENLMKSLGKQQHAGASESSLPKMKDKQCSYFINEMNDADFGDSGYKLRIP
ncbi:hypothetical protein SLEP1_g20331 [Rubroshorea leprosula]|uniref:Uncharacterized protein n=1 Tax=Rubroshorea leprosula TaxID=152421 RepID=A0AAV5J2B4_9ROSI|nr:hypothetical protein SLEP1_g20331 [Rubroshorea leprosula]